MYTDNDNDGYAVNSTISIVCTDGFCSLAIPIFYDGIDDCDDNNTGIHPGAHQEVCNGIDEDCDGIADDGISCNFITYYVNSILVYPFKNKNSVPQNLSCRVQVGLMHFNNLRDALAMAVYGDTIKSSPGIYYLMKILGYTDNVRDSSFIIPNDDSGWI